MNRTSKRYRKNREGIEAGKLYAIEEAVAILKNTTRAKFDESVEMHIRLGINTKKGDQQVRGTLQLPHGTGKSQRIAVFAIDTKANEAKEAGADVIGGTELIEAIQKTEKCDFDIAIATPDMMPKLGKIARILGPKGLMPSPKTETVTMDVKSTTAALKKGKIDFKADDQGLIHQILGKMSFTEEQLAENARAFLDVIRKNKPESSKGEFILSVTLTSTMGPGIRLKRQ